MKKKRGKTNTDSWASPHAHWMRTYEVGTGNVCLPPSWWLWNEPTMESPHPPLYCPALCWTGEGSREAVLAERSDTAETHWQEDRGAFRSCSDSVHVQGPPTPHLLWPVAPHSSHAHISSFLHQAREDTPLVLFRGTSFHSTQKAAPARVQWTFLGCPLCTKGWASLTALGITPPTSVLSAWV